MGDCHEADADAVVPLAVCRRQFEAIRQEHEVLSQQVQEIHTAVTNDQKHDLEFIKRLLMWALGVLGAVFGGAALWIICRMLGD